jgi:glutamyl-tRNA reductase
MQLFTFGLNHQTAPLDVRERVVFHAERLTQALHDLVDRRRVNEAAIISTCNRTEIYCNTDDPTQAVGWLAGYHRMKPQQLEPYLYHLPREQAVKHAFRVASGLDSMVLGEPQILGQFKEAVRTAEAAGTLGLVLNKLFQKTFSVAKTVRTETEIGTSTVSMAAAAVQLAGRIYPSVAGQNVLFVGAGEMIELCAAHFAAQHPKHITFANRTEARAHQLAERFLGRVISLNDLPAQLALQDIVVCSTASPLPLIGKGLVESALKARKHRPMLMFDLAVPRDIEAEVATLDDAFLYTVDDLGKIAREGLVLRQNAVAQAEVIIENHVTDFMHWLGNRDVVPAIRAIRDAADRSRRHELERAERRLAKGEDAQRVLEELSRGLMNKLLHAPTHALNHASEEERDALLATLSRLYNINRPE